MAGTAQAAETEAQFIDRVYLQPHHGPVTGEMVLNLREWYGLSPAWTLAFMAAETSLADPELGGRLVGANNFFCMKYSSKATPWSELSNGKIKVGRSTWFTFPAPDVGMSAWGRLMKLRFLPMLQAGGVGAAATKYYGAKVAGLGAYKLRLVRFESKMKAKAAEAGWEW